MSKYTAEQVLAMERNLDVCAASVIAPELRSMLREYAAHLAAQAEWPSDALHTAASVRAELVSKIGDCCQGGDPLCAGGCHVEEAAKRNAALQSVRPPVGVVSDEDVELFKSDFAEHSTLSPDYDSCIKAALESYASRHAPTKD